MVCRCCCRTKPSTLLFNCEKFALSSGRKFVNRHLKQAKYGQFLDPLESKLRKVKAAELVAGSIDSVSFSINGNVCCRVVEGLM